MVGACGACGPRAGPCVPSPATPIRGASQRPADLETAESSRSRRGGGRTTSPTRPRRRGPQRPARCALRTCARPRARVRRAHRRGGSRWTRAERRELLFASTARVPLMCTGITGTPHRLARYEAPPLNSRPQPSALRPPSGKMMRLQPSPMRLAARSAERRLTFERSIGIAPRPKDQTAAFHWRSKK